MGALLGEDAGSLITNQNNSVTASCVEELWFRTSGILGLIISVLNILREKSIRFLETELCASSSLLG